MVGTHTLYGYSFYSFSSHFSLFLQLTVLNAGRKYLGVESLAGRVFLTSGLGGMSGAQAKAAVICGCIGVIAEVRQEHYFILIHSLCCGVYKSPIQ